MRNSILLTLVTIALNSITLFSQSLPEGTKVRLRSDQMISSSTAQAGQRISFTVAEDVEVDGNVIIERGAQATGTITKADHKKSFGRSGKLDFNMEYVKAANGEKIPLRANSQKAKGNGKAGVTTTLVVASAIWFPPALVGGFFIKGSEVGINPGQQFDCFTDGDFQFSKKSAKRRLDRAEDENPESYPKVSRRN